jgi:hypothetical protein
LFKRCVLLLTYLTLVLATVITFCRSLNGVRAQVSFTASTIEIDYPQQSSIFPPEITPPTMLWHDETAGVSRWQIEVSFSDGTPNLRVESPGDAPRIGEIDPPCVSPSNELPGFSPRIASDHAWIPDVNTWETIKKHSQSHPATLSFEGITAGTSNIVSRGTVTIQTSNDPVGAPIFYRDVPLIPSKSESGVIKPLAQSDLPLLAWRLRDISQPSSRVLLTGMHTCANCHSFSGDGKVLGMDLDGPGNDKGLYFLTEVRPQMTVTNRDVISWSAIRDAESSISRIGFMSQISPNGRYVVTMMRGLKSELASSYFVINFPNYRFLQVFYPTRGTLAWYDRTTGEKHPLPGADDPQYVQTNPVWSPDAKYIVFARATARPPIAPGQKMPDHALAPEETQIKFDLYRVPFNDGKGGTPEPIEGASNNGMSNSFAKISPDGHWLVFVQSKNGLLMRPDSKLYIIPASGGTARLLECNTSLMNSWHSFSPNGHWLVFSSKSRSPYTQMFLTHIDEQGHSSPAILIDNATAANRAVNIPEFVNIPPDGMIKIDVPAAESYRLYDQAADLTARGELEPSIAAWQKVLKLDPNNAHAQLNLGIALQVHGDLPDAQRHLQRARELEPSIEFTDSDLGVAFLNREQFRTAVRQNDCANVLLYGKRLLAVASKDEEVDEAVASCDSGRTH